MLKKDNINNDQVLSECPLPIYHTDDIINKHFKYTMHGAINMLPDTKIREIQILSEYEAKLAYMYNDDENIIDTSVPTAIISIGSWGRLYQRPEFTIGKNGVTNVLQVEFADKCDTPLYTKKKIITQDQANEIADFIKNINKTNAERIAVHCGAGISRSSAVAACCSLYFWGDDQWVFEESVLWTPNITVYLKINEALGWLQDKQYAIAKHQHSEWGYWGDTWLEDSYNLTKEEYNERCILKNNATSYSPRGWTKSKDPLNHIHHK